MQQSQNQTGSQLDLLIIRVREGDKRAYREFLAEAAIVVRRTLARKIGHESELEDIVQEVLIACHEKHHTLDPGRPVGPWLRAIAGYKLIDYWRKRGRSPIVLDDEADLPVAAEDLAGVDVAALLGLLPQAQAEAIQMTHIEGLTNQEASERAGIGLSAMKLRVHRGMNRLKEIVDEQKA